MNDITMDEILSLVASKSYCSKLLAGRIWNNIVLLIISELQNNSYIRFENFGKFELIQTGGKDEWVCNEYGAMEKRWVDFNISIKFSPSKNLIDSIKTGSKDDWFKHKCDTDLVVKGTPKGNFEDRARLEICEDMKDKIYTLAERRRSMNLKNKEEKVKNIWNMGIICKENNKKYDSVRSCANDLGVSYITLIREYHKAINSNNKNMAIFGYNFEILDGV